MSIDGATIACGAKDMVRPNVKIECDWKNKYCTCSFGNLICVFGKYVLEIVEWKNAATSRIIEEIGEAWARW